MSELEMCVHYVTYYYPGSFFPETSRKQVPDWDSERAYLASSSDPRKPYAFKFVTLGRTAEELNSREIARSPTYFLGGSLMSLEEVLASPGSDLKTLAENMQANGWDRVIRARYGNYQPFGPEDTLLPLD